MQEAMQQEHERFMGVGMGMNAMNQTLSGLGALQTPQDQQGQMYGNAAQSQMAGGMNQGQNAGAMNQSQPNPAGSAAGTWTCECGRTNTGKFCSECGKPAPAPKNEWTCECGHVNTGKFCSECGNRHRQQSGRVNVVRSTKENSAVTVEKRGTNYGSDQFNVQIVMEN
mgnify:FL=1